MGRSSLVPRGSGNAAAEQAAKLRLTTRQMALVDHVLEYGGTVKDAALTVGYSDPAVAYNTLKLPHVAQYMLQRTAQVLGVGAMSAAAKMVKLSNGAKSEYVQLEASKDILDRAGFKPPERSQVQVSQDITVHIDLGD